MRIVIVPGVVMPGVTMVVTSVVMPGVVVRSVVRWRRLVVRMLAASIAAMIVPDRCRRFMRMRMGMAFAMVMVMAAAGVMVMHMARVRMGCVPVFGGNDRREFAVHGRYCTPWGYYRVKRCLATRHPRRLEYENR